MAYRTGIAAWFVALASLTGCGTAGSIGSAVLDLAGVRTPQRLPESLQPPREVPLRLHASAGLNHGPDGQALALVARVYKLRRVESFERVSYESLQNAHLERQLLGDDLIEVREVLLVPDQRYEVVEKVSREAGYIGVVALFRTPAQQRWRLAFNASEAEQAGITLGLHRCAISVGAGASATTAIPAAPLASVPCQ